MHAEAGGQQEQLAAEQPGDDAAMHLQGDRRTDRRQDVNHDDHHGRPLEEPALPIRLGAADRLERPTVGLDPGRRAVESGDDAVTMASGSVGARNPSRPCQRRDRTGCFVSGSMRICNSITGRFRFRARSTSSSVPPALPAGSEGARQISRSLSRANSRFTSRNRSCRSWASLTNRTWMTCGPASKPRAVRRCSSEKSGPPEPDAARYSSGCWGRKTRCIQPARRQAWVKSVSPPIATCEIPQKKYGRSWIPNSAGFAQERLERAPHGLFDMVGVDVGVSLPVVKLSHAGEAGPDDER